MYVQYNFVNNYMKQVCENIQTLVYIYTNIYAYMNVYIVECR